MNCVVLQENLHQALTIVLRSIGSKNELPVLNNVLLEAKEGKLFLSGTDFEIGTRVHIGGKVEKEGSVTVPARLLGEFISTLKSEKITILLKEATLVIKGVTSQASFATIAASEFPPFPQKGERVSILSLDEAQRISERVAFAASSDEGRAHLTGVLVKAVDGGIKVAATDGFRLSVQQLKSKPDKLTESIIPARCFQEVARIGIEKKSNTVEIYGAKSGNQLVFLLPDCEIFTRLIDGEFPSYERIIPTEFKTRVVVDAQSLMQGVKAASVFARESANIVRMRLSKGKITLSANTPQVGDEQSDLEATVEGDDNEIAFNFRFLLDFLGSSGDDQIIMEMTSPLSPALFHPGKDSSYTHVIMPVRVQQ